MRSLISLVVAIAVIAVCEALVAPAESKKPHLLFILIDDLGFNDFPTRSSDLTDSVWPNVAKLIPEAVTIENYYTQPICTPTRGAFMTGRYPARLGLQHAVIAGFQDYGLPLDEVTLADKLKAEGYGTYAVGKWHLGAYNWESTPTYRGFDTFFGYWNGAEDHLTHEVQNLLDLHIQEGTNHTAITDKSGTYSTYMFSSAMVDTIKAHKAGSSAPGFFYYAMQNVHVPLEVPSSGDFESACSSVVNADRKTYCSMAFLADEAIGNVTDAFKATFDGEDYVVVIAGDNGGSPQGAGNNMPLRGQKGQLWEGGVRNNAIVWGSALPESSRGTIFDNGMVHVTDIHETFASLASAKTKGKPVDGKNIWDAITTGSASPRTEFLINYDPCSGHGACSGVEYAYREGDYKLLVGVTPGQYTPIPTSAESNLKLKGRSLSASSAEGDAELDGGAKNCANSGLQFWDETYYRGVKEGLSPNVLKVHINELRSDNTSSANTTVGPKPVCLAHIKSYCPSGQSTTQCAACISGNWSSISSWCPAYTEAALSAYMCSGGGGGGSSSVYLYNITADPTESTNLATALDGASDIILRLQAAVSAIVNGTDYKPACNVPDGSCYNTDETGYSKCSAAGQWLPWIDSA